MAFKPKLNQRGGPTHNRSAVFTHAGAGTVQKVPDVLEEAFARLKPHKYQMEES